MAENYRHPNPIIDLLRHVEPFRTVRRIWRESREHRATCHLNIPQEHRFQEQHAFRAQPQAEKLMQDATRHIIEHGGHSVVAGPFQDMQYVEEAFYSGYTPKLLGCYEAELQDAMEDIITTGCDAVIDIGAAEGWYAIGLARRLPQAKIIAFEMDEHARGLCLAMAKLNKVSERVDIRGTCDINSLAQAFNDLSTVRPDHVLVICDCEGYEEVLMQPEHVPQLRQCHLIIELHDCLNLGVTNTIVRRFRETHDIRLIDSVYRDPDQFSVCHFLPSAERVLAVDDQRGHWMQWAVLSPRAENTPNHAKSR